MTLSQIENFIAVAESGSFSQAAERLYLTPQALIQQIARLERELGFRLLLRTSRGVSLSAAGKTYYQGVKALLPSYRACEERARQQAQHALTLRIGLPEHVNCTFLLSVCREFSRRYPEVQLRYEPLSREDTVRALLRGEIDLAAQIKPKERTAYCCQPLFPVAYYCLVARDNALAGKSRVTLADLSGYTVGFWDPQSTFHRLDRQIAAQGLNIRLRPLPENISETLVFCMEGNVLLTSAPLISHMRSTLAVLPLDFDPGIYYHIAYLEEKSEQAQRFIAVAREIALAENHPWRQALELAGVALQFPSKS